MANAPIPWTAPQPCHKPGVSEATDSNVSEGPAVTLSTGGLGLITALHRTKPPAPLHPHAGSTTIPCGDPLLARSPDLDLPLIRICRVWKNGVPEDAVPRMGSPADPAGRSGPDKVSSGVIK